MKCNELAEGTFCQLRLALFSSLPSLAPARHYRGVQSVRVWLTLCGHHHTLASQMADHFGWFISNKVEPAASVVAAAALFFFLAPLFCFTYLPAIWLAGWWQYHGKYLFYRLAWRQGSVWQCVSLCSLIASPHDH